MNNQNILGAFNLGMNEKHKNFKLEEEYKKILQISREIVLILRNDKIVFL
jgi:hypothetical protein